MTRFIAVLSGKGGVGKTTTTMNVGHALSKKGHKVLLVDANLATPNLGFHIGLLHPEATVNHVLRREKHVLDAIYEHSCGISIIPGSPNFAEFQKTNHHDISRLFQLLDNTVDFVLVDCPSGFGPELNSILKHTDESLIVVNPTMSSLMEAVKSLNIARSQNNMIPGVVLNKVNRFSRHQLSLDDIEELLGVHVIATIKNDRKITKSLHKELPVTHLYPRSRSAKRYNDIASHLTMEVR